MTDSLSIAFSWMGTNPIYSPQLTGYKNLEASGLLSVSDDKLRGSIIGYYLDAEFYTEWGRKTQKFFDENFGPRVISDFKEFNFHQKAIPFDFKKIKSDLIFMNIIQSANRQSYITLEGLEGHKEHAENFINQLPNREDNNVH